MIRHIEDETFKARGYSRFDPRGTHYANHAWQKRFYDGEKTAYFLNFYQYEYPSDEFPKATMAEGNFYLPDREHEWVTVELHYCNDLDYAERFFADVYAKLGMVPDRHNNGAD